jgi:uncharacterized protein
MWGIHPQLMPAAIGAVVGFPVLLAWAYSLVRQRRKIAPTRLWLCSGALALCGLSYAVNCDAWLIEPSTLVVRRVEIASPHWHGAPLTMAVVSDTHVSSPHVSAARVRRIVARVNALHPEIVLLLGDYAGGHEPEAQRSGPERSEVLAGVAAFAALRAPLGTIAVIGNHDSWYGRQTMADALKEAGVTVLWNENAAVARGHDGFIIAGLADADTGAPSFARSREGALPDADTIVISHSPDPFAQAPNDIALMLAGHTHCGQVTLPLIGRPIVPSRYGQRYACGRIDENGRILFVTAGVGTSILPLRFLNPPEIVLVRLRAARRS